MGAGGGGGGGGRGGVNPSGSATVTISKMLYNDKKDKNILVKLFSGVTGLPPW